MDTKQANFIENLFSVGAHFGCTPSRRHPSQAHFVFGTKGGVEIFDLEKTGAQLEEAVALVTKLATQRKTVLFVGGKAEVRTEVQRAAERINQPFVTSRWIGGSLTNLAEISKRTTRLADLSDKRERGELSQFTKLERLLIDREITDLETMFGGIRSMTKLPDALIVVDPRYEAGAVEEAKQKNIPIIAIANTDCDTRGIKLVIPANDASRETVRFILDTLSKAYMDNLGKETPVRE